MRRREVLKASVALSSLGLNRAEASDWPNREVSVILPVSAGGANDLVARAIFAHVSSALKVPFIIKNVPGANATLGTTQLASAKSDGYTIGNLAFSALLLSPHVMKVPYTLASFDPIASAAEPLYGLGVATDSPTRDVADLIKLAQQRRVTVSSNTIINVVCMYELNASKGTKFQWIPTNSQAEAVTQAAGGHVDCTLQSAPELNAVVDSGRLRLLAGANEVGWPTRPELKTLKQLGYPAASVVPLGYGAPRGVDPAIRARLEGLILEAATQPDIQKTMAACGAVSRPLNALQLAAAFTKAAPEMEQIMVAAGLKKG